MRKVLIGFLVLLVGGFILLQLVPYGRNHSNPPVVSEPTWDSPQTLALAERACFDCHSNETVWPWYSNIAPVSWLVQNDVSEGREHLNFSNWGAAGGEGQEGDEMSRSVLSGAMPPATFLLTHPEARLSADEKQQLAAGLMTMGGGEREGGSEGERDDDGD